MSNEGACEAVVVIPQGMPGGITFIPDSPASWHKREQWRK